MARGPSYWVPYRRRKEGKTNYKLRRALILSNLPRLVVRNTLKHTIVQIIKAEKSGDKVIVSAHSSELAKSHGWKGSSRNIPAAYLTGLLCGYRAALNGVKKAVLDIGLQSPSKGAKVFASLKGVSDAGVTVPHKQRVIPDDSRICGQHIVDFANQLSTNLDAYQRRFSNYLQRDLQPEKVIEHFSIIKEMIVSLFEGKMT